MPVRNRTQGHKKTLSWCDSRYQKAAGGDGPALFCWALLKLLSRPTAHGASPPPWTIASSFRGPLSTSRWFERMWKCETFASTCVSTSHALGDPPFFSFFSRHSDPARLDACRYTRLRTCLTRVSIRVPAYTHGHTDVCALHMPDFCFRP